jgi:hypothetical protein
MDAASKPGGAGGGGRPAATAGTGASGGGPTEQQQRAAKVLAALEKQIGERIDRDFFAEEGSFRPLVNVIDVLGSSDGAVNNVSLERLRGQCELATMAMEKFVDENYGCVFMCVIECLCVCVCVIGVLDLAPGLPPFNSHPPEPIHSIKSLHLHQPN